MRNTEGAFKWIVGVLQMNNVPFQITGGFAARLYGSTRELADIDIDIPRYAFERILPDITTYVVWGPDQYVDDEWDLFLATLEYEGQEIDLCCIEAKMRNTTTGEWEESYVELADMVMQKVYGIDVPVVRKDKLIEYKRILGRPADIQDVAELTQ